MEIEEVMLETDGNKKQTKVNAKKKSLKTRISLIL